MIINQQNLTGLYQSVKTTFKDAYDNTPSVLDKLATTVVSGTREEQYAWLGRFPKMREWIGERVIDNLSAYGFVIKNRDWEATVEVDRNDIEDDAYGVYSPMFKAMGESARLHPDVLLFELIAGGFTGKCYDEQFYFDTDHPRESGGVQSNKDTAALSADSYAAARAQMMALVDDKGKTLNIIPDLLVVPPQLERTALELLRATLLDGGGSNVYAGTAEPLVVPALAGNPTAWYLFDTKKFVKPFVFQRRKEPNFVSLDKPDDENVFMKKKFIYGVDSRDNAGYGLWQLGYASTGAGA